MTQTVILLSASQFRITNDKTGEVENEGTTVRYVISDNLSPHADNTRPAIGRSPAKATMPYDYFDTLQIAPAFYNAELEFAVDSKGNAKITATDFKFVSGINVSKEDAALNLKIKGAQ